MHAWMVGLMDANETNAKKGILTLVTIKQRNVLHIYMKQLLILYLNVSHCKTLK